jgi:pimeloyl-ACP methyl ester carboxylesterase
MRCRLSPLLVVLISCAHSGRIAQRPHCIGANDIDVTTNDGATIALHRHQGDGEPVLIVHGISSNHVCWDLTAETSLATYLSDAGFDPWLLDLRGHGNSGATEPTPIDTYGEEDVAAALQFISESTGVDKVHYVGHSMGGNVAIAYLVSVTAEESLIDRMVLAATPLDFSDAEPLLYNGLHAGAFAANVFGQLPTQIAARLHRVIPDALPIDIFLFNDINEPAAMYENVVSPVNPIELSQFAGATSGAFYRWDSDIIVTDYMGDITTPTLVVAGRADRVAPVDRVYPIYPALGSEEKEFLILGVSTGFSVDYGHLDMTTGDHTATELYPIIEEWLSK